MIETGLPFSDIVRLHQIGAGLTRRLEPDATVRARIARSLELDRLDALIADLEVTPTPSGWKLHGHLRADLAQTCGITLEPLPVEIDDRFTVFLAEASEPETEDDEILVTLDDETPDLLEDGRLDLGQYVVEQLALRLDPFPRKPGAAFVQPPEPAEISPFAVLRDRKPSGEG